jgi:hypothetical protein
MIFINMNNVTVDALYDNAHMFLIILIKHCQNLKQLQL